MATLGWGKQKHNQTHGIGQSIRFRVRVARFSAKSISPQSVFCAAAPPLVYHSGATWSVGPVLPLPANGSDVRNQLVSIYEVLLRREPRSWGYPYSSLNREPRSYGEFPSIWHVGKRKSSVDMTTCRSDCQHSFAISFISTLVRHFIAFAFLHSLTASHVVVLFGKIN